MPRPAVMLLALWTAAFTLATWLEPWHSGWQGARSQDQGFLALFLGDGRRLFADYFFRKADIYFHSGVYPSIFDQTASRDENHMAEASSAQVEADQTAGHDQDHDHAELPQQKDTPVDWLDRFSRNFYPTRHVHLEESANAGEILPWIRISAELNPQRVETFTTAAYWLRSHKGEIDEAEKFLREGLRANPGSYEILFELGRLYDEGRKNPERARNLYELALKQWRAQSNPDDEGLLLMYRQIVVHLAWLEERQGNLAKAIQYWKSIQQVLPDLPAVQDRVNELQSRLQSNSPAPVVP